MIKQRKETIQKVYRNHKQTIIDARRHQQGGNCPLEKTEWI